MPSAAASKPSLWNSTEAANCRPCLRVDPVCTRLLAERRSGQRGRRRREGDRRHRPSGPGRALSCRTQSRPPHGFGTNAALWQSLPEPTEPAWDAMTAGIHRTGGHVSSSSSTPGPGSAGSRPLPSSVATLLRAVAPASGASSFLGAAWGRRRSGVPGTRGIKRASSGLRLLRPPGPGPSPWSARRRIDVCEL